MVIFGAIAYRKFIGPTNKLKYLLIVSLLIYLVVSIDNNLRFVKVYDQSKKNWLEIGRLVHENQFGDVRLPDHLLSHPHILPVDENLVKLYVKKTYGRNALVCSDMDGYDFSRQNLSTQIVLESFYNAEQPGRWTSGPLAQIHFLRNLEKGSIVEITISGTFAENSILPVKFEMGDVTTSQIIRNGGVVRLKVDHDLKSPVLVIHVPKPTSPLSLELSGDNRILGIMVNKVNIIQINANGEEKDVTGRCN